MSDGAWCNECGQMTTRPETHAGVDCLKTQVARHKADAAAWKEAWFRQREATGTMAWEQPRSACLTAIDIARDDRERELHMKALLDPRRKVSETLTIEAESAWADSECERARMLFGEAAAIEEAVARDTPMCLHRARSAIAIAAVALWCRAGDFDRGRLVGRSFLGQNSGLTGQAREALERLVDRCTREAELARITRETGGT